MERSDFTPEEERLIEEIEKIDEILERNYGNIRDALKEVGVEND